MLLASFHVSEEKIQIQNRIGKVFYKINHLGVHEAKLAFNRTFALSEKKIAGAALDCFNDEPVLKPNRFSELDNVILAPHSIAWTQELFRDIGMMCSQHMIDLANGIRPHGVVNPEIFDRPSFQEKWKALRVQPNPISS